MISVFIIIGIIVLVAFTLVISLYKGILPDILPKKADAITTFTEACVHGIAEEGLNIMKVQGGFIDLPEELIEDGAYINIGFKVPYWYHDGRNYMPTYLILERQLKSYIDRNLLNCINDYRDFPQYTITPLNNFTTKVTFTDKRVLVDTDYRLMVQPKTDEVLYLDDFNVEVKTNFGEFFNLATDLMNHENKDMFLENYTDEMIASSDWLPYEGMLLSCSPEVWHVPDMKKYTQTMIMHNLPFLMFENTDYEETGIPYYDGQYKVDFTNNHYEDIAVDVIYNPNWGMEYSVLPSKNGIVKPFEFKINEYLRSCFKIYHHRYNAVYPVLFKLSGDNDFFFATPVIMKQNMPNRYKEVNPWALEVDAIGSRFYCADSAKVTAYSIDSGNLIQATPSIRNNRKYSLRVFARDALSGDEMPGVNISYHCIRYRCPIGVTTYPTANGFLTGGVPMLNDRFPDCTNGFVIAERSGYHQGRTQVSVSKDTDRSQTIVELYPLKQFDYAIKVIENHNGLITERDLNEDEHVLININHDEMLFEKNIVYPSDNEYFTNLSLIIGDFTYDLDIKLVTEDTYLGGAVLNWTLGAGQLSSSRMIVFYVLKLDPIVPPSSPEEYQQIHDYARINSKNYMPELR